MAEIPPIERVISGKGIIKIPQAFNKARQILLYVDLLRPPTNEYQNYTWNPSRSFYAHVAFCIDNYVLYDYDVNFAQQVFQVFEGQDSQNYLALYCSHEDVLNSFVQYAVASGFPYFKNNSIKDYPYTVFIPNNIKFFCYTDCALRLTLSAREFFTCDPDAGQPTPPPPPPPPPENPVPPGTPVDIDPPYDGGNDGGDTVPNPIDEPEEPPQPPTCTPVVVVTSTDEGAPGMPAFVNRSNILLAPVRNLRIGQSLSNPGEIAWLIDSGSVDIPECPFLITQLAVAQNPDATGSIVSITPL